MLSWRYVVAVGQQHGEGAGAGGGPLLGLEDGEEQAGEVEVALVEVALVGVEGGEEAVERGGGVGVDDAALG